MGIIGIIFIGFAIYGIILIIQGALAEKEKLSKMTAREKSEYRKAQREREEKAKYNNLMYTCPMCGSKKIKTISTTNRGISVAMFGASSGKIGKCYECDDCKYKW